MGRTRKNRLCPFLTIKNLISVFRVYTKLEMVSQNLVDRLLYGLEHEKIVKLTACVP